MVTWVVFLVIGLLIGVVAGYFFGRLDDSGERKSVVLKHSLEETEKNFLEYQQQVQKHFMKTGTLVNAMTKTYQEVHAHLAESAKALCDYRQQDSKLEHISLEALETSILSDQSLENDAARAELKETEALSVDVQEETKAMTASVESTAAHDAPVTMDSTEKRIVH